MPGSAVAKLLTQPEFVSGDQPCLIRPASSTDNYEFRFIFHTEGDQRAVSEIEVYRAAVRMAVLPVPDMQPAGLEEPLFFGPQDINFDGYLDLMLRTRHGLVNAAALYWLFESTSASWTPLGEYPILEPDAEARRLFTLERGGHGGRIYDRNEYSIIDRQMTLLRSERQRLLRQPSTFQRTIREPRNGVLTVTSRTTVSGDGGSL